ncbi:hypothetical protein ACWYXO_05115 [Janthinobacterium aestuarii]
MQLLKLISLLIFLAPFSSANSEELLLERQDFRECEAQTMTALSIARNAMHLKDSKQSMLDVKSTAEFQRATTSEVDEEIARTGSNDHVRFAAKKLFQCSKLAGLPIKEDWQAATFCLARQDILFYLAIDREQGRPEGEADVRIRKRFSNSSKSIYSDPIIDRFVPLVYQVTDNEDEYKLRRYMFETCYLPDEWRAWDKSIQSAKLSAQTINNNEVLERIKAKARVAHPNDHTAQNAVINMELASYVDKQTGNPKLAATILFLGYYMKNTHGVPSVCLEHGVSMVNFPKAFSAANQEVMDVTRVTMDTPGVRDHAMALASPAARRELDRFAEVKNTDIKGACLFLETDAQGMADRMSFAKILPAQYQALLGTK